ncbi:beta-lactamase regulating signal transducer with metallopeptidase domain [Flavobacterium sp. 1]|uniref:M56 family metallopeptidase n=1 Tax=Flavobacterium sp. 1 TaxID=2035200 RepID=UPI000C23EA5B|nr:M56 family metallopeptidase [Flavobacterium sp. 1]PJJ08685.1 beta-lactamase regulating signal transducer with metallopeptidase domain [Flavobacterium sp. 1]
MIPYILYTALILSACLAFYKLLLQKETFFHLNRFVLLGCMILAFILPLLPVPQQLSLRKVAVENHIPLAKAAVDKSQAIELKSPPVQEVIVEQTKQTFDVEMLLQWLVYLYWFGVLIFALNFLVQACVLFYRAYSLSAIQDGKFRIVEITGDKAPCSFANNIFINPEKYEWETYTQILQHEKIHIEQKHTIDLLLSEVVLIFQWFNPFAWQWRKALESNLEFLTDNEMLQQDTVEKESYQFSLLKVAAPHFPLSLTTNYNQSLIKKRIIMMNSKKSSVHTTWKYFFLLPLLILFVCLFNQPAAQGQTLNLNEEPKEQSNTQNGMETEGSWFAVIKGNTVNIQFRSGEENNSSTTFQLSELKGLTKDVKGEFTLTREAGTMNFEGKFEGNNGMGTYKFTADKKFSAAMAQEGVTVADETDIMVFFMVNVKVSYVKMLKKNGYKNIDKDQLIPLVSLDANEEYINSIKQAGIPNFDLDDLIPFKSMGIDKAFIDEIRQAGYNNITADNIIALKSQGINGKFITDFHNSTNGNHDDETGDNIIAFKSLNIDAAFIDSFKKMGYNDLSNDDLMAFKSLNITPAYISEFEKVGYNNLKPDDLMAFKSLNITPAYIDEFEKVGYTNLKPDDLMALKSLNITPKYIGEFEKIGYKNIKPDDLFALKSQNITPDLINEYKALGFNDLNIDNVIGAKSMGVSPAFIKSMKDKGHNFKTLEKYMELKAVVGVN